MDYATDLVLAFCERCGAESYEHEPYWTDVRVARIVAKAATTHSCLGSAWAVDPYVFGVCARLGRCWGSERRNALVYMLLDKLCDWTAPTRMAQLGELLVLFLEGWSVAEAVRLVAGYLSTWQRHSRAALLRELGLKWPRSTLVQFFAMLLGLLYPPADAVVRERGVRVGVRGKMQVELLVAHSPSAPGSGSPGRAPDDSEASADSTSCAHELFASGNATGDFLEQNASRDAHEGDQDPVDEKSLIVYHITQYWREEDRSLLINLVL